MRLHYLFSRLRALERAVYERRFAVQLDTGETVTGMDFSCLARGCHQAVNGERTQDAYIALHACACADEYGGKFIAMLKAVTHPVDTTP